MKRCDVCIRIGGGRVVAPLTRLPARSLMVRGMSGARQVTLLALETDCGKRLVTRMLDYPVMRRAPHGGILKEPGLVENVTPVVRASTTPRAATLVPRRWELPAMWRNGMATYVAHGVCGHQAVTIESEPA